MSENITCPFSLVEFFDRMDNTDVVVPKIQRAYAQGRESESSLRERFVENLFTALEGDKLLELNFVYGSKSKEKSDRLELLDGQQRITTLILLYWYLACAENRDIPEFIKSFSYETRLSTGDFLRRLADNKICAFVKEPSEEIRSRQWYDGVFDKDTSVRGMLRMLDAIHARLQSSGEKGQLYDRLGQIKFYELDLESFGLTEEIYIKMNARGLPLTPFENFKADLVKFMRESKLPELTRKVTMPGEARAQAPYHLYFEKKMDNGWLNIFWSAADKSGRESSARFFRFFYRFFAGKVFLEEAGANRPEDFNKKGIKNWDFFWSESPDQDKTYFGFDFYRETLEKRPDYIAQIELVLNWLEDEKNRELLERELIDPWDSGRALFFEDKYILADAVKFTAFCEYIIASGATFDAANFRRWMRLVRNAVNDLFLRNPDVYVGAARTLREQALALPGATTDLNGALASREISGARWLREAVKKAKIICANPDQDWEGAFIKAESLPFFAGSIASLLHELPATPQEFSKRAQRAGQLFDGSGITEEGRKNHRLIRAMARQFNTVEELVTRPETIFTERNDSDHHLRSNLADKESAGRFLCVLADMQSLNAAMAYLDSFVDTEPDVKNEAPDLLAASPLLANAWKRLCQDPRIYDYIARVETEQRKSKFLVFMPRPFTTSDGEALTTYSIDRKNSWYDRLYIGVDRRPIFKKALELGYDFYESKDRDFYDAFGDVPNDGLNHGGEHYSGIWLSKKAAPDVTLYLSVYMDGWVWFSIDANARKPSGNFEMEEFNPETRKKLRLERLDATAPQGLAALADTDKNLCAAFQNVSQ